MYNTKFILSNGIEVYPGYLNRESRTDLLNQFRSKREFMWCGCKSEKKLFYRISEDLRIYPEHNNYQHDRYCSRYINEIGEVERKTGYIINEETGSVTTYLSFNPKILDLKENVDKEASNNIEEESDLDQDENEATIEKDTGLKKNDEKKEPKLTLASLIRSINVDTYSERVLNHKKIESKEAFSKLVYYRMNNVKVSRMRKSIGDLTLENDGVKFIYVPFLGAIKKEEKGLKKYYICTRGKDNKVYNNFVFPDTMNKTIKDFVKTYGIEPNQDTMLGAFQYIKKTKSGVQYKVLGRIHLFQISNIGIYVRSTKEKEIFDYICQMIEFDNDIKFWIPPDDESVGGIVEVLGKKKKILLLFRTKKDEHFSYDNSIYEPLVIGQDDPITREYLYKFIEQMD